MTDRRTDRQTDRIAMARRDTAVAAVARKKVRGNLIKTYTKQIQIVHYFKNVD